MKPFLHIFSAAVLTTASLVADAQTALPYYTNFDSPSAQANWIQHKKGMTGFYHWEFALQAYSTPTCLVHDYPVGGGPAFTRDWFVSPGFTFSSGGKIDSVRYAFNGFGVPNANDTVAIYLLNGSSDPGLATSLTLLKDFRGADYIADGTWRKLTNVAIPPSPGTSYIAFKYVTDANWLDVKFDNLAISAPPAASFSLSASSVCKSTFITLKDLSTNSPTSWSWQIPGGTPSSATSSMVTVSYATAGTYTISLTSSNTSGPSSITTQTVQVSACTGLAEEKNTGSGVMLYPNPALKGSSLNVVFPSGVESAVRFTITNILGELVYDKTLTGVSSQQVDLDLPSGTYIYRLHGNNEILKAGKLIVE